MNKLDSTKRACALFVMCAATAIALPAQTFTVLHSFDNTDGSQPLRGTSSGHQWEPVWDNGQCGGGTIFKITPSGTLTSLYSFCSRSGCADGLDPVAPLVEDAGGNFYGTTFYGGVTNNSCNYLGSCGTVFKITPSGTLATLYSFCSQSNCTDGDEPFAGLVQATDGNFYGTTYYGGENNYGTIFKITPSGTLTTLYSLCSQTDCSDGEYPGGLVQATNGDFYGTTYSAGANGSGTVFKISASGALTTLHSFCSQTNCTDGGLPLAGLIQATNGNLYGTTVGGGPNGDGTVFEITPSGTLTTLYSFCSQSGCTDGESPFAGLVQATDGNFYGTTLYGGTSKACYGSCGTVFEITPSGTLTTLHSFGGTDGAYPQAALVQDTKGTFYGTTVFGGADNDGTIFTLSVGLAPFVETQPDHGKVGRVIEILGTNLTGATSVTFNGTAAVFKVISGSLIGATVPAGATSGKVQVVTPSGTLTSNVPFRVGQ